MRWLFRALGAAAGAGLLAVPAALPLLADIGVYGYRFAGGENYVAARGGSARITTYNPGTYGSAQEHTAEWTMVDPPDGSHWFQAGWIKLAGQDSQPWLFYEYGCGNPWPCRYSIQVSIGEHEYRVYYDPSTWHVEVDGVEVATANRQVVGFWDGGRVSNYGETHDARNHMGGTYYTRVGLQNLQYLPLSGGWWTSTPQPALHVTNNGDTGAGYDASVWWDSRFGNYTVDNWTHAGPGTHEDQGSDRYISYEGPWTYSTWWDGTPPGPSGGSVHYSNSQGALVSFNFYGSSVTYKYSKAWNRGVALVYVDGFQVGAVDEYAPNIQWQQTTSFAVAGGLHNVQVMVCGCKGNPNATNWYVDLDAFITY